MKRSRACFVAPSSSSPLVPPHDNAAAAAAADDDDDGGGGDVENHRHAARAKQSKVNVTTRLAAAPPPSQQEPNLPLLLNHYVAQDIANVYKQNNVHTLHRWQAEALSQPGVLDGTHNLVYSAPTSGGKSLVAEILLVKRAMERPTKVSLVVLPFVSLCEEKAEHLEKVVHGANLKVQRAYSDLGGGGSALFDNANIVVCTIERANGIIQRLMASSDEEGKGMPRLATVVVDETHMVGEPSRGIMLEQMLAKLVWWRHYRSGKGGGGGGGGGGGSNPNNNHLQIVAMSATIPNLDEFGRWLHPARVYKTDLRPVQLHRYLCDLSKNGTLWDVDGNLLERRIVGLKLEDRLNRLILEPWAEGHSALVFCNSKMNCEIEAKKLAERIRNHAEFRAATMLSKKNSAERQEVFDRRTKHAADLRIQNDKELASCVEQGCAWHHANLTRESRAIVERAYKQGAVSVLFATSTLAAGVNLPARRVIFREPFKAHAMQADCMLTPRDYLQMAGRAGRTGIDSLGEAYLCYTGKGKGCTFDNLQTLLKSAPDPVISTLRPDSDGRSRQMVAALHEVINGGVVQSREDLEQYLKCFLLTKQSSLPPKAHTTKGSVAAAGDGDGTHADPDVAMTPAAAHADGGTVPAASAEPPEPPIKVAAEFAFKHLIETKQVQVLHEGSVLDGTKLGKAAASSGVRPHDAVNVAKFLTAACDDGIVLLSHLEPIYLSLYGEPRASSIQQDHAIRLRDMLYRPGDKSHLPRGAVSVAKKHAPERVVEAIAAGRLSAKKKAEVEKTVAAFYYALALMELCMDSTRLAVIAEQYKIDKGILQELMGVSAKRCSMFERFADGIELKDLACVFGNAKKTVGLGAQPEVVQLMAVKYMTKPLAVALCRAGICSVSSLAHATPYLIQQAIKKIQGSAGPEPRRKAHQLQKHARKLFRAMEEENQRELDRLEEAMANMAEREVAVSAEAEEAEMEVEVQRNAPVASLGVRRLSASLPAVSHPRELSHGTGTTTTTTTASSDASESGMKSYDSGHVLSTADDLNWLVSLCESSPWFAFCLIVPPCRVLAVRALPGSG